MISAPEIAPIMALFFFRIGMIMYIIHHIPFDISTLKDMMIDDSLFKPLFVLQRGYCPLPLTQTKQG